MKGVIILNEKLDAKGIADNFGKEIYQKSIIRAKRRGTAKGLDLVRWKKE